MKCGTPPRICDACSIDSQLVCLDGPDLHRRSTRTFEDFGRFRRDKSGQGSPRNGCSDEALRADSAMPPPMPTRSWTPFQEVVDWFVEWNPISPRTSGCHDYDHLLPLHVRCPNSRNGQAQEFLSRVEAIDPKTTFHLECACDQGVVRTRCGSGFSSPRRFAPGSRCRVARRAWETRFSLVHAVLRPVSPPPRSITRTSRALAAFP